MKLVSYLEDGHERLGICIENKVFALDHLHPELPGNMSVLLTYWSDYYSIASNLEDKIKGGKLLKETSVVIDDIFLLAPVTFPNSIREANAFQDTDPSYQYPEFRFINHHSMQGQGKVYCMPDFLKKLDFQMQVAIVIGHPGRNIPAAEADNYIAGLMIANSFNACGLRSGDDIQTAAGPMLITTDDLASFETAAPEGHTGKTWNLPMKCFVNEALVCEANVADMKYTFAEIIERCSYGVYLQPGDVILSGVPVNGSFARQAHAEPWLNENDEVVIEVEALGKLKSTIVKDESDFSLLDR